MGLLYHQFYPSTESDTLRQFHLSHIKPLLEYTHSVWDPYLTKERLLLEDVQSCHAKSAVKAGTWTTNAC